jgi:hypothetical protein
MLALKAAGCIKPPQAVIIPPKNLVYIFHPLPVRISQ